jgi:hypothetical protein
MQRTRLFIVGLLGTALAGAGASGCNSILGIGNGTLADGGASGAASGSTSGTSLGTASGTSSEATSGASSGVTSGAAGSISGVTSGASSGSSSTGSSSGAVGASAFDGTTGKVCKTDADCRPMNGPGINQCSVNMALTKGTVVAQEYPTPVCLKPGNCDPAPPGDPQGAMAHYCDGPDEVTSPGRCVPLTKSPSAGQGACVPQCAFALDGSSPTGCAGNDTCVPFDVSTDASGTVLGGRGFCQGTCEKDTDCAALGGSYVCQTDIGYCTAAKVVRTKAIGASCSTADDTSGACNCELAAETSTGTAYCTSACIVGGAVPCANGWICDDFQSSMLPGGITLNSENVHTSGICMPPCALDGANTCPPNSACVSVTPVGPECQPGGGPTGTGMDAGAGDASDGGCAMGLGLGPQCLSGQIGCCGSCINDQTDPNNCGGCRRKCSGATPSCANGACTAGDGGPISVPL